MSNNGFPIFKPQNPFSSASTTTVNPFSINNSNNLPFNNSINQNQIYNNSSSANNFLGNNNILTNNNNSNYGQSNIQSNLITYDSMRNNYNTINVPKFNNNYLNFNNSQNDILDLNKFTVDQRGTKGFDKMPFKNFEENEMINNIPKVVIRNMTHICGKPAFSSFPIEQLRIIDIKNHSNNQTKAILDKAYENTNILQDTNNNQQIPGENSLNNNISNNYSSLHNNLNFSDNLNKPRDSTFFPFSNISNVKVVPNNNLFNSNNLLGNNINSSNILNIGNTNSYPSIINNVPFNNTNTINNNNLTTPFQNNLVLGSSNFSNTNSILNQKSNLDYSLNIPNLNKDNQNQIVFPFSNNQNNASTSNNIFGNSILSSQNLINSNPGLVTFNNNSLINQNSNQILFQNSNLNNINNLIEKQMLQKYNSKEYIHPIEKILEDQNKFKFLKNLDTAVNSLNRNFYHNEIENLDFIREKGFYEFDVGLKQNKVANEIFSNFNSFNYSHKVNNNHIIINEFKDNFSIKENTNINTKESNLVVKNKSKNSNLSDTRLNSNETQPLKHFSKEVKISNFFSQNPNLNFNYNKDIDNYNNDKYSINSDITLNQVDEIPTYVNYYEEYYNPKNRGIGLIKLQLIDFTITEHNHSVFDIIAQIYIKGSVLKETLIQKMKDLNIISNNSQIEKEDIKIYCKDDSFDDNQQLIQNVFLFYSLNKYDISKYNSTTNNFLKFSITDPRFNMKLQTHSNKNKIPNFNINNFDEYSVNKINNTNNLCSDSVESFVISSDKRIITESSSNLNIIPISKPFSINESK
jgi:hypothetical protein